MSPYMAGIDGHRARGEADAGGNPISVGAESEEVRRHHLSDLSRHQGDGDLTLIRA
jgi:hypothetical protein